MKSSRMYCSKSVDATVNHEKEENIKFIENEFSRIFIYVECAYKSFSVKFSYEKWLLCRVERGPYYK